MKQNLYIPGDLVMTKGFPLAAAKGVVYRITATMKLHDGAVLKGVVCLENIEGTEPGDRGYLTNECGAWVKDIIPIPLTSEILKKNGWKKGYFKYEEPFGFKKIIDPLVEWEGFTYLSLSPAFNDEGFSFWFNNQKLKNVQFIHQLQHLLFGLGLDSNMIV